MSYRTNRRTKGTFPIKTDRTRSMNLRYESKIQASRVRGEQYLREYLRLGGTNHVGDSFIAHIIDYSGHKQELPFLQILHGESVENRAKHVALLQGYGASQIESIESLPGAEWYLRVHGADAFKQYMLDPLRRSLGQPVPMEN